MTPVIIVLIVASILQLIVTKVSLWFFIALVGRILFCTRMVGATTKVKTSIIWEGVAFTSNILWTLTVHNDLKHWKIVGLFLLFSAVCCLVEIYDDLCYVYITDTDDAYDTSVTDYNAYMAEGERRKKNVKMPGNNKGKRSKRNGSTKGKDRRRNKSH